MFKVTNKKNHKFISQFIKEEIEFNESSIASLKNYALFQEELEKASSSQRLALLTDACSSYLVQKPIKQVLQLERVGEELVQTDSVPEALQSSFNKLMLEFGQEIIGCSMNEEGGLTFNRRIFAERVMQIYDLVVNLQDPETLLVYNKYKGYWADGTHSLNRLIIEIAHSVGGDIKDTWNSNLERSIMDILKRKATLIESANFNNGYFPLGNYTLNSSTGGVEKHSASNLSTFGSPVNYNKDAECPIFKNFLAETFDDDSTIKFVQEWFGYTLSTSHKANALLIGIGTGANGKSTLFEVLAQLVGIENVSSAPLSNFNRDFGLEPLIGMKMNLATESDTDGFKTGKLKALTSGEKIAINRKNLREISQVLPVKLTFLVNALPIVTDSSFGYVRRLIILPFDNTYPPEKQDKDLPKKLSKELEGVLIWSLEGLDRLIKNYYQFTISKSMKEAKDQYFGVGNPVEKFIKDCIISSPSKVMESKEIFNAYCFWMSEKGYPFKGTDNTQVFWREFGGAASLQLIEFKKSKSNGKTVVRDLDLK